MHHAETAGLDCGSVINAKDTSRFVSSRIVSARKLHAAGRSRRAQPEVRTQEIQDLMTLSKVLGLSSEARGNAFYDAAVER